MRTLLSVLFLLPLLIGCKENPFIEDAHGGGIVNYIKASVAAFTNTNSINFDSAASDHLDCKNVPVTTAMTICFWVKDDSVTVGRVPINKWSSSTNERSFIVLVAASGKAQVLLSTNGTSATKDYTTAGTVFSPSSWNQMCVVIDTAGNSLNLYVNGSLDSPTKTTDGSIAAGLFSSSAEMYLGAQRRTGGGSPGSFFDGKIDHVSVWNAALNSTAISNTRSASKPADLSTHASVANLVNWWQLGDAGDTITADGVLDSVGSNDCNPVNLTSGDIVSDVP